MELGKGEKDFLKKYSKPARTDSVQRSAAGIDKVLFV